MENFAEIAAMTVDSWRAQDGGLTWGASDVIRLGNYIDRLFARMDAVELSPEDVMDILWEMQWAANGAEVSLLDDAMTRLRERS